MAYQLQSSIIKSMKKILALATLGITGLLAYCAITKKRNQQTGTKKYDMYRKKEHHATDVFAKAKQYL